MSKFKVGIIGCGRPWNTAGATGYGMAHAHAAGYEASPDAEIVAAADISQENLDAFCAEHAVPHGYLSADEMFAKERLDIVSLCLWPHLHAPMTLKAVAAGVKAVHCEKPMALTYGDAQAMVAACDAAGVQLTFNHMRRFGAPFRKAQAMLKAGDIGELERLEAFTANLYDWGTHWFDMLFMFNDEAPVEWVIGQIDARGGGTIFGAPLEGQGLSQFKFKNGVLGLMITGQANNGLRSAGCAIRLVGSEGIIEIGVSHDVPLRLHNVFTCGMWQTIEVSGGIHGSGQDLHVLGILDLIDALKTGREPELSGHRALQATELIFATYESSRRRARVDLPLDTEDSALITMINAGDVVPWYDGYVAANGLRFHYWRTGGDKPSVVLCHGFSDNGLCWLPVARALEADYDVIMLDARGHGLSDAPEDGYTTEDRAADLAACIRALGLEKPAVLGHSMGGATAAYAAYKYPELIGKALLEDPAWWDDNPHQPMTEEERQTFVEERRAGILAQKSKSREALMAQCRKDCPAWAEEELGNWAISKQQMSPYVIGIFEQQRPPWREMVAEIRCPVLLITANVERGAIVTPPMAEEAARIAPHLQVAPIPTAGHNVRREDFPAYMAAVKAFLHNS